jgi:hypothetical protein
VGWIFGIVAVIVIVAIALVAVGKVTAELAAAPRVSVFDLDEAVDYIAERLPLDTAGQLSYDDVRLILGWHLDYLEERGVATEARLDDLPTTPVVTDDDGSVAYVLGRASDAGLDVADEQVVEVLDLQMAYLGAIGAIGGAVPEPPDPV